MPRAQDATLWTPELKRKAPGADGPLIATDVERRDGSRPSGPVEPEPQLPVGVIFADNFDDQPDWTSTLFSTDSAQIAATGHTLPVGWDAVYQGTQWSPETGHPDRNASIQILASNSDKVRTGTKSAVFWRESYTNDSPDPFLWASDGQLVKLLPQEYDELYVEFWIKFSPTWFGRAPSDVLSKSWASKIFRVGHWQENSNWGTLFNGALGYVGPLFLWNWMRDSFGIRNFQARRGGPPQSGSYGFQGNFQGDFSGNYNTDMNGRGLNGTDALVPDRVNGGWLKDAPGPIQHDQIFGQVGDDWTKIAFYLKMNSAPGVPDGIYRQFINDVQFNSVENVPWCSTTPEGRMVGWNYFAIGGNDWFHQFPPQDRYEDWYSIDNLVVRADMPEGVS